MSARYDDDPSGDEFLLREAPSGAGAGRLRRAVVALAAIGAFTLIAALAAAGKEQPFTWQQPFLIAPSSLAPGAGTGYSLAAVACASEVLCVAAARGGNAFATTDPSGGGDAWTPHALSLDPLRSVSCPTTTLCVVSDDQGIVFTSSDPGAADAHWSSAVATPEGVGGLSCPNASLCVGVDDGGSVVTSTHPVDGTGAWAAAPVDAANFPLTAVDCPSASLCVATDAYGNVVTSHDPAGGVQAWQLANVDGTHPLLELACPTTSLCVALDRDGNTVVSNDPAGGPGAWRVNGNLGHTLPTALACPTADRCVATDGADVLVSDDPAGESPDWQSVHLGDAVQLNGLACPSVGFCVGVDGRGFAVIGTGDPPTGSVSLTLAGDGHGTVTGGGLTCPPACSGSYPRGAVLTFSATPDAQSQFAGWSDPCAGDGSCAITVTHATTVVANFAPVPSQPGFLLSVEVGGNGSVKGPGIDCPQGQCQARAAVGAHVTLTATAGRGWRFGGWDGDCRGGRTRCSLVADADRKVNAVFARIGHAAIRFWSLDGHDARFAFRTTPRRRATRCALTRVTERRPHPAPRYAPCRSPKTYAGLRAGSYVFRVRTDEPSGPPARRRFTLR